MKHTTQNIIIIIVVIAALVLAYRIYYPKITDNYMNAKIAYNSYDRSPPFSVVSAHQPMPMPPIDPLQLYAFAPVHHFSPAEISRMSPIQQQLFD